MCHFSTSAWISSIKIYHLLFTSFVHSFNLWLWLFFFCIEFLIVNVVWMENTYSTNDSLVYFLFYFFGLTYPLFMYSQSEVIIHPLLFNDNFVYSYVGMWFKMTKRLKLLLLIQWKSVIMWCKCYIATGDAHTISWLNFVVLDEIIVALVISTICS